MEDLNVKLYTDKELAQIISYYEDMLRIFVRSIWSPFIRETWIGLNDFITDIKRGLTDWTTSKYWDYLYSTHSTAEWLIWDEFDKKILCRCIKIKFGSWKELILSHSHLKELPANVLSLDKYYMRLDPRSQKRFNENRMHLQNIEQNHFKSPSYQRKLQQIQWDIRDVLLQHNS